MHFVKRIQLFFPLHFRTINDDFFPHGKGVIRHVRKHEGIYNFERRWRQHFVDTMKPKYLPPKWSVDHKHARTHLYSWWRTCTVYPFRSCFIEWIVGPSLQHGPRIGHLCYICYTSMIPEVIFKAESLCEIQDVHLGTYMYLQINAVFKDLPYSIL